MSWESIRKFIIGDPPSEEVRERVRQKQARRGPGGSMGVFARLFLSIFIALVVYVLLKLFLGVGILPEIALMLAVVIAWFALEGQAKR